jgi:hypothetical protein
VPSLGGWLGLLVLLVAWLVGRRVRLVPPTPVKLTTPYKQLIIQDIEYYS